MSSGNRIRYARQTLGNFESVHCLARTVMNYTCKLTTSSSCKKPSLAPPTIWVSYHRIRTNLALPSFSRVAIYSLARHPSSTLYKTTQHGITCASKRPRTNKKINIPQAAVISSSSLSSSQTALPIDR
ncbi:Hypothetical protein NTJ_04312 [Nesidiocoris tenuis]|uniref:Uncharacterized protein n=1 Tax=Nesidiocoris tenuis TaxID=355587 RepID=A0ABN7AJE8_9HEMI|nr:Hypothetical protein NTJ_04312 [Nesidiocoris tenuis]